MPELASGGTDSFLLCKGRQTGSQGWQQGRQGSGLTDRGTAPKHLDKTGAEQ